MYKQGRSLGRQIAREFGEEILSLISRTEGQVWFLGRDCDVIAAAFRKFPNVRYLVGLNRDNARKLQHRGRLSRWLRSIGVRPGDALVDSGYSGTIYERIVLDDQEFASTIRLVLLTANPEGFTGEPITEAAVCGDDAARRHIILALEHSPKREVIGWDDQRRRPVVWKNGDAAASRFFDGCVAAIKEELNM